MGMDEIDRRKFIKLAFLALAAGCAPRTTVKDPEDEFLSVYNGKISRDPSQRPLRLPDRRRAIPTTAGQLEIIPRSQWAASRPIPNRLNSMGSIYRMTVHHEGNPRANYDINKSDVANNLELIRKLHLKRMTAGDIGYHYIIDRAGRIWEGRYLTYQGAHVGGSTNVGNIGIMLLGNFDIQQPSEAQRQSLKRFLVYLKNRHHISHGQIHTHQELKPSQCPGINLQSYMNKLRRTSV
jgi:hypothetical protein